MFPIIPLVCAAGFIASACGMAWYGTLPEEEQTKADKLAASFAWQLFQTSVDNLTHEQAETVAVLVRDKLTS